MVCTWNKVDGSVTVLEAYKALVSLTSDYDCRWWHSVIWKYKIPLKITLFMWLCLYNKVLTREEYRKRGGIGPSVCLLCLNSEETVQHLFVECPIAQELWFSICRSLKLN